MSEALIEAISAHDMERIAQLLAAGEDPNAPFTSRYPFTPLHNAVGELEALSETEPGGSIDAVVLLLRYGADANAWNEDRSTTPIIMAVELNHIECVRLLLAAGADPNVCGSEGESPLRLCAENGLLEMARLLLQCGADKAIHESGGAAGMNALGLAATRLNLDMVRLLLAHGADPQLPDLDRMTTLDHLRRFPHVALPETPLARERFHEIRRLLGAPDP